MEIKNKSELIQELQTRSQFFSIASQELRNPLTGLKLQSEMIARRLESEKEEVCIDRMRKALRHFHSDIHRLSLVVEEMTDLSQICNNKFDLHREHFQLSSFLKELKVKLVQMFHDFDQLMTWNVQGDLIVFWDKERIRQVLINVISHHCNYGGETPMKMTVSHDQNQVTLLLADNSPGLGTEELKQHHGFGLGLFICQEIVQMHGGRIQLENNLGYGSNFTITLPADK